MRVKSRLVVQALDGFEAVGLDRTSLLSAAGLSGGVVEGPYIEWTTFASLLDVGWGKLGKDPQRMRQVGAAIARAPSYEVLQRLARTVVSLNRLYDVATRWAAPAAFPDFPLTCEVVSEHRLRFLGTIPEPHATSIALNHLFEGVLIETPTLLGLPRATVVTSRVTPREIDVVVDLPPSTSLTARFGRAIRAVLHAGDGLDLLEAQRRDLADALLEARRSNEENWALLDHLPDLVMIHRDGTILWMNRANVLALGYERFEELAGKPLLDLVEPAARQRVVARMRQPAGADSPEVGEIRLMTRDGRVVVVEISPSQQITFEGKPARLVAGRDVTERARMQEQLRIADRMASIGMLAAGVAHEVNNPLGYVLNNIEIAQRELAPLGESQSRSRAALDVALEGVDRIRTIVRDLLALSRVDDAIIGPVDVLQVLTSTLTLAGKDLAERAVLSFEHEPVAPVAGSPARLGQVFLNLVTNALEAMRSSARDDNQLRIVLRPAGAESIVVEVTDNGLGIAREHATRIFDPFFTTKPHGKGTGLGLAISQRLVDEMGGQLSFESTPGVGSTFRVTLPVWPGSADGAGER